MDGRRQSERRETLGYWPAHELGSEDAVGLVTDLSNDGVHIHSIHSFKKGQRLHIRLSVDEVLIGSSEISLEIENVWCRPSAVASLYHAGFRIVNLPDHQKENLEKLIKAFSYPSSGYGDKAAR